MSINDLSMNSLLELSAVYTRTLYERAESDGQSRIRSRLTDYVKVVEDELIRSGVIEERKTNV